jgi:superfamily II RNA helicase
MTTSGDMDMYHNKTDGTTVRPGSIEEFYQRMNANTIEEKIEKLEKQLQEFPNHQMPKDRRLKELQFKFNRLRADMDQRVVDKKAEQKKWMDAYKQVNDNKNPIDVPPTPFEQALMRGGVHIDKEGFDG